MPDLKRELSQWFTPLPLARKIANWAWLAGRVVLEPTAGSGNLVLAALEAGAKHVVAVEADPEWAGYLEEIFAGEPVTVICADFLDPVVQETLRDYFDEIGEKPVGLLNPPYEKHGEAFFTEACFAAGCERATLLARIQALHNTKRYDICFRHRPIVQGARVTRRPWFGAESSGKFSEYAVTTHSHSHAVSDSLTAEMWETWTDDSWTRKAMKNG